MTSPWPALLLALLPLAAIPVVRPPAPAVRACDDDATPMMQEMEKLEAAMEFLKRSVLDAAQDAKSLEQVVVAQQACLASKQLVPKMAAGVAETERAKFVADYRKAMGASLIELIHLESALLDGDRERARATWKKLDGMRDDGHNAFTEGE